MVSLKDYRCGASAAVSDMWIAFAGQESRSPTATATQAIELSRP
jgi:hypothetical protein